MFKIRVVYDIGEGIESNFSSAEIGMPVFLCTTHIFTVVNMKDRNLIFTDQMIKLVDHTVEITTDIITTVVSVAGIKTDTQFVAVDYAVIDCCKFFKRPAKFRPFSRHGFQCNMKRRVFCQDFIEPLYDLLKSGFNSGTDVGTRMQNQSLAFAGGRAVNFFCQKFHGQFICLRFYGITKIDNIRSVNDDI